MLRVRRDPLAAFILMLAGVIYFGFLAPYGLNLDDEGTILYQIYRTAIGQVLYVDFHAGYTPGVFWWNAFLFRLFGVNALVIRLALALINSGAALLIYFLARRIGANRMASAGVALGYIALIPFYDGQFFSANIPYPVWYVTLAWLASLYAMDRAWVLDRLVWWCVTGVVSGLVFAFKPNSGLLCLAGLLIAGVNLESPQKPDSGSLFWYRLSRVLQLFVPLILAAGLTRMFAHTGWREVLLFPLPLLLLIGFLLWRPPSVVRGITPQRWLWSGACLAGGFVAINLPWVVYYLQVLGLRKFLRAILFVGTNFEKFYYIAYPPFSRWGLVLCILAAAGVIAGILVRYRVLPRSLVVMGAILGGAGMSLAILRHPPPMIEGFHAALQSRIRDVSFVWFLGLEWVGVLGAMVLFERVRREKRVEARESCLVRSRRAGALLIVLTGAVLMHMQLYPRTDFMHLVPAIPGLLVLGALLLDRIGTLWGVALMRRPSGVRALRVAVALPVLLVSAALMFPGFQRIGYLLRAWTGGDPSALVQLDAQRAPFYVEPAGSTMFISLRETARFLRENTAPNETVFTFPVLDILCFLSDRHNPTRHGYFFPGWPGHAVEAEVVDSLSTNPPRFTVALHDHSFFFATAPVYYFNLRQHMLRDFRLTRRIGIFDVLRPRGSEQLKVRTSVRAEIDPVRLWRTQLRHDGDVSSRRLLKLLEQLEDPTPDALADAFAKLDGNSQEKLVWLIRKSRSRLGAAALALTLERNELPASIRELIVRIIVEVGGEDAIPPLLRLLTEAQGAERLVVSGMLYNISSKLSLENYWFGVPAGRTLKQIRALVDPSLLIRWLDDPWESLALRLFAVRAAGRLEERQAIPFLARLVGDAFEWDDLRTAAVSSLSHMEATSPVMPAIVSLLKFDSTWVPTLLVRNYRGEADQIRPGLIAFMSAISDDTRSLAYWIAAGVRDPQLKGELQRGLHDPVVDVRIAAVWGLGRLGDPASRESLQAALQDPSDEVVEFARRALERETTLQE